MRKRRKRGVRRPAAPIRALLSLVFLSFLVLFHGEIFDVFDLEDAQVVDRLEHLRGGYFARIVFYDCLPFSPVHVSSLNPVQLHQSTLHRRGTQRSGDAVDLKERGFACVPSLRNRWPRRERQNQTEKKPLCSPLHGSYSLLNVLVKVLSPRCSISRVTSIRRHARATRSWQTLFAQVLEGSLVEAFKALEAQRNDLLAEAQQRRDYGCDDRRIKSQSGESKLSELDDLHS